MTVRLSRMLSPLLLVCSFCACSTEELEEQPVGFGSEASYVAAIEQETSRTFYEENTNSNGRPFFKAWWGDGEKQTTETISLFSAEGNSCGDLTATIAKGGESKAKFVGILKDGLTPTKAYYSKGVQVSSLKTLLDLTSQKQAASGNTAHLSGQDYMEGIVTTTSGENSKMNTGTIAFSHLTAVVKYSLTFPTIEENETGDETVVAETESGSEADAPQSLMIKAVSLIQASEEEPVLKLKQTLDGTSSQTFPDLTLTFKETNGMVAVPEDNTLEAYISVFPSSTENKSFTLTAQSPNGLYSSKKFTVNQNFTSGKLYTITTGMNRLTQFDWYFNPDTDEKGNKVYTITTGDELAAFSCIVNGEAGLDAPDNFAGKTVKLQTEEGRDTLSLEGYQPWTPIGKTADTPFKGTFDGNGKTITNLKTDPNKDYQGFFGFLDGATIKNLTIEGEVEGKNYVGAVAAYAINSTFEDCTFGKPNMSGFHVTGLNWIGGVISYAKGSVFEKCVNYGPVTGGESGYVGGLGGGSQECSLRGCTNYGGVAAGAGGCGGGLMGFMNRGSISGCTNYGEMTSVAGTIASILANIAAEMANKVQIIGSYSSADNGTDVWGFGTGDYIVNGSYYTGGKGDDEWYRGTGLSPEDYANMNELINGEGLGFDENGNLIDTNPTDFGSGNVNDFEGGGYLE